MSIHVYPIYSLIRSLTYILCYVTQQRKSLKINSKNTRKVRNKSNKHLILTVTEM